MPQFIPNAQGRTVTVYTAAERDFYIQSFGKSPQSFTASPSYVATKFSWDEPRYHYVANPTEGDWWRSNFASDEQKVPKPLFFEIFTGGRGPLTGEEVRAEIARTGVKIYEHTAVSTYNTKLDADHELYSEDLDMQELGEQLNPDDYERLKRVNDWVASMLGAAPVYFGFKTDKIISEDLRLIDGIQHAEIKDVQKVPSIGIAFMGPKALKRDVFNAGIGEWADPGVRSMQMPGRDRPFRLTGIETFSAYLFSPVLAVTSLQVSQLQEGRKVSFELSPVLPPWLLSR